MDFNLSNHTISYVVKCFCILWRTLATDGSLVLKYLHRKRGKEAIDAFGIIPFYFGVLIHDRWASYFAYDPCKHQVCGSHLLRDLTFVVDSNNYCRARLMKKLLCECCDAVNKSETNVLSEAECRRFRKRYRTFVTQGGKEMRPKFLKDGKANVVGSQRRMHTICTRPC